VSRYPSAARAQREHDRHVGSTRLQRSTANRKRAPDRHDDVDAEPAILLVEVVGERGDCSRPAKRSKSRDSW
jgi:hypothetical protein